MPELPEVETTVRLLRPMLEGRRIRGGRVLWPGTLAGRDPADFLAALEGARMLRLRRRAKFVVADLGRGDGPAGALLVHLRMSGRLVLTEHGRGAGPYERLRLRLDRGWLHFIDVRKFGRVLHCRDPEEVLGPLGPEPLDRSFSVEALAALLHGRRRMLKPLLLDQTVVAGLGNIYVDEALHRARLHPLVPAASLSRRAVLRLHRGIRSTLRDAIRREGSSFDTFYRTPAGRPGRFQESFRVYGRAGRPCRACGRTIRRLVVAQRGTHVCLRCQRPPGPGAQAVRAQSRQSCI